MSAIRIDRDGCVTREARPIDVWMDDDTTWDAIGYPGRTDHAIYFDDMALFEDPDLVRASIAGAQVPLPVFIVGVDGERDCIPTISIEQVEKDLDNVTSYRATR